MIALIIVSLICVFSAFQLYILVKILKILDDEWKFRQERFAKFDNFYALNDNADDYKNNENNQNNENICDGSEDFIESSSQDLDKNNENNETFINNNQFNEDKEENLNQSNEDEEEFSTYSYENVDTSNSDSDSNDNKSATSYDSSYYSSSSSYESYESSELDIDYSFDLPSSLIYKIAERVSVYINDKFAVRTLFSDFPLKKTFEFLKTLDLSDPSSAKKSPLFVIINRKPIQVIPKNLPEELSRELHEISDANYEYYNINDKYISYKSVDSFIDDSFIKHIETDLDFPISIGNMDLFCKVFDTIGPDFVKSEDSSNSLKLVGFTSQISTYRRVVRKLVIQNSYKVNKAILCDYADKKIASCEFSLLIKPNTSSNSSDSSNLSGLSDLSEKSKSKTTYMISDLDGFDLKYRYELLVRLQRYLNAYRFVPDLITNDEDSMLWFYTFDFYRIYEKGEAIAECMYRFMAKYQISLDWRKLIKFADSSTLSRSLFELRWELDTDNCTLRIRTLKDKDRENWELTETEKSYNKYDSYAKRIIKSRYIEDSNKYSKYSRYKYNNSIIKHIIFRIDNKDRISPESSQEDIFKRTGIQRNLDKLKRYIMSTYLNQKADWKNWLETKLGEPYSISRVFIDVRDTFKDPFDEINRNLYGFLVEINEIIYRPFHLDINERMLRKVESLFKEIAEKHAFGFDSTVYDLKNNVFEYVRNLIMRDDMNDINDTDQTKSGKVINQNNQNNFKDLDSMIQEKINEIHYSHIDGFRFSDNTSAKKIYDHIMENMPFEIYLNDSAIEGLGYVFDGAAYRTIDIPIDFYFRTIEKRRKINEILELSKLSESSGQLEINTTSYNSTYDSMRGGIVEVDLKKYPNSLVKKYEWKISHEDDSCYYIKMIPDHPITFKNILVADEKPGLNEKIMDCFYIFPGEYNYDKYKLRYVIENEIKNKNEKK